MTIVLGLVILVVASAVGVIALAVRNLLASSRRGHEAPRGAAPRPRPSARTATTWTTSATPTVPKPRAQTATATGTAWLTTSPPPHQSPQSNQRFPRLTAHRESRT